MATLDSDNPPIFQRFESWDRKPLTSLPTHVCPETSKRYILWVDIQSTFADVVFLRRPRGSDHVRDMILFMIDRGGELRRPLSINNLLGRAYTVVRGDLPVRQTEHFLQSQREHGDPSTSTKITDSGQNPMRPLVQLFEEARAIYGRLADSGTRDIFQQRVANARYFGAMLIQEMEANDKAGLNVLVDGMDRSQILDSLGKWEQKVPRLDYENICRNMLSQHNEGWNCAIPRLFVVLPSCLDSWIDIDTSTHQFRLYFLCDFKIDDDNAPQNSDQHIHFSNHRGHHLNRPLEFLQTYGDYVLRVLQIVKYGYSTASYEIPSLNNFKILWGCDPEVTGKHLSKDAIGGLIDKAIGYLQDFSPPQWRTRLRLTYSPSAAIKSYLDVQDDDNAEGNLRRHINIFQHVSWICEIHLHNYRPVRLERLDDDLKEFAASHGGYIDMQQAMIRVELGSATEADRFRDLLKDASAFDISIKLTWKATHEEMMSCLDFLRMEAKVLEVDGFATDIHRQDHNQANIDSFLDHDDDDDLKIMAFLNYPSPQEHCLHIGNIELRLKSPPKRPFYDWEELRSDLIEFGKIVTRTRLPSECVTASRELQLAIKDNELPEVTAIHIHDESWVGVFDLKVGAFVEVHSNDMKLPDIVASTGSVHKLMQYLSDTEHDQDLYCFVQAANKLQELGITTYGRDVRSQIEFIGRLHDPWNSPLRLTLFDITHPDPRQRNVAQITIHAERRHLESISVLEIHDVNGPLADSQEDAQGSPMILEVTYWDCDYSLSPLSDYHASFLDLATLQHPSVLTSFTLDVLSRSAHCLASIQNIVGQSSLEHLVVMCSSFDNILSESIVKILQSIPWRTLKSLVLMGDSIDEWIQIWPPLIASSLLCLQIVGLGSMTQELSHPSVMFVHELIFTNTLVGLHFENIQLKDGRDWRLIVESMDPSMLDCLCLCAHSSSQLLVTVEAVDLFLWIFKSGSQDMTNQRTVHQTAFNLDIIHLSFLGLIHAENVLRRSYNLERLSIVCSSFDTSLSATVVRVLELVPWTKLKSLVLSGDNIDEWIQLIATDVTPRLYSLEVRNAGSTPLELSHASALFIQKLVTASPMKALTLQNIVLWYKNDWVPIIESVDTPSLRDFKLCERGKSDLLTCADAVDLYMSKLSFK